MIVFFVEVVVVVGGFVWWRFGEIVVLWFVALL